MNRTADLLKHLVPLIYYLDDTNYTSSVTIEFDNGLRDKISTSWERPNVSEIKNGVYDSIIRNEKIGLFPVRALVEQHSHAGCTFNQYVVKCTPDGVVR